MLYTAPQIASALIIPLLLLLILAPLASKVSLVDIPSQRKFHQGHIPLIGGIAIYLSILINLLLWAELNQKLLAFLIAAGLLVAVGIIDDKKNLKVRYRVTLEFIAASIMVFGANLWIGNLGSLFGMGEIHMPFWLAYPFTMIAVFGTINAINMTDGLDGLAGGTCLIVFSVLLLETSNSNIIQNAGLFIAGGLTAFLLCNFPVHAKLPKVFLGDAGSKLLGLCIVWALIETTQSGGNYRGGIEPVTALYILGFPLIDMVATTVRRVKKGVSPFNPDRSHFHHILQRAGFSKKSSILTTLCIVLAITLLGLLLRIFNIPAVVQFVIFFALYFIYAFNVRHAWKLSKKLKEVKNCNTKNDLDHY